MRPETEAASGANWIKAVHRGPKETPPHPLRQRRILWICVLGWAAFACFALWWLLKGNGGLSVWVFEERNLDQPGFTDKFQSIFRGELGLQRAYPWILFGPFVALMAWYFPLERERLRRNLPLNTAVCLAFAWACHAIYLRTTGTYPRLEMVHSDYSPGPPRSRNVSLRSTILDLLAYGAITGLVHSVNFYGRFRERERRALFLESNLANARLNALKAQLQPHFLFNSLNAIAALLRRDPRLAETTLVALSELLRLALSQSERQEGALREELEFVQRYLEIQQTRFGDKLRVEQDIQPQALDCMTPTLVLQPLVENAIRHGIEPADKAGVVRVSAFRVDGKLVLTVEDDGVGFASGNAVSSDPDNPAGSCPSLLATARNSAPSVALARAGTGIGLANLRERLQALYGAQQILELTPRATGGVIVRVEIPWRQRASSETTGSIEA
jgi:two-component system, LytTR family, sensor kinase